MYLYYETCSSLYILRAVSFTLLFAMGSDCYQSLHMISLCKTCYGKCDKLPHQTPIIKCNANIVDTSTCIYLKTCYGKCDKLSHQTPIIKCNANIVDTSTCIYLKFNPYQVVLDFSDGIAVATKKCLEESLSPILELSCSGDWV